MKFFFTTFLLSLISCNFSSLCAHEAAVLSASKGCSEEKQIPISECKCVQGIFDSECIEEEDPLDPLEPLNRGVFWVNNILDMVLIEPIAGMYKDLIPEYVRDRIGFVLRNLNEPIVFANNLLQGELEDARVTLGRFIFNSTVGVAGIFDVATDWGLPYKKQDLGLTFASWGISPGPYLVLPILGPSNGRDAWGRIGDFSMDPINIYAPILQANMRTCAQIVDANASVMGVTDDLKKNSLDPYTTFRSWYYERRKFLAVKVKEREAIDTPRPDDED